MGIKANNAIWHGNTRFNRNTEIKDSKSINRIHEKHNRERKKNRIKKIKMGLRTKERGNKIQKKQRNKKRVENTNIPKSIKKRRVVNVHERKKDTIHSV